MPGVEQGDNIHLGALLIIAALIAVVYRAGIHVSHVLRGRGGRSHSWKRYSRYRFPQHGKPDLSNSTEQLSAVMAASFEKQKLLSSSEYRVFRSIEDVIAAARRGYRVFAQINLGEILRSQNDDAYRSINSKRVDILIVDWRGLPVLAVEYQGGRHYQGDAAARDAVKKEALRRAGVPYLEIFPANSDEEIKSLVRKQLGWNVATGAAEHRISRVAAS